MGFGGAKKDGVREGLAIDGVGDRAPQFLALQPRAIFSLGGPRREVEPQRIGIDADAGLHELHGAARFEPAQSGEILGTHLCRHQIGRAALQPEQLGVLFRHDLQLELIEPRQRRALARLDASSAGYARRSCARRERSS